MRLTTGAVLIGAALLLSVGAGMILAPASCRLQIIPDYVTPIGYRAVLRLAPVCPAGTVLRVRKSSTLSTKASGAKYQPIKPLTGAWEVGHPYTPVVRPVPPRELWTSQVGTPWQWQFWDERKLNTLTGKRGAWVAGEVLRAAP